MEDVTKLPYLVLREGVYYYRRRVPSELRAAYGAPEVGGSLFTSDFREAVIAWSEQNANWDGVFDDLRRGLGVRDREPELKALEQQPPLRVRRGERLRAIRRRKGNHEGLRPLDADAALRLARVWFSLESDMRLFSPLPENVEEAIADRAQEVALFEHDASSPPALQSIQSAADLLLEEHRYGGFPGEAAYERLCEYLGRAMLEVARLDLDRQRRDFRRKGYDHLFLNDAAVSPQGVSVAQTVAGGVTVKEACDQFRVAQIDERRDLKKRSKDKAKTGLDLVVEFFGADTLLASIDIEQCEAYQTFLRGLPPNSSKVRNGRSLREIAETAAKRGEQGLMRATRESYYTPLRQLFAWAKKRKFVTDNPAKEVTEGRLAPGDARERHSYTPEQLRRIFNAPLYRGCVDDGRGFNKPGNNHPRRGRFWLPLLGLFTGAREGELCQLRCEDIRESDKGTPYIRLHEEGKGMSLKNKNSWRSIPIHPELEKIGFLEFVRARRKSGDANLFPEMLVEDRMASYRFSKLYSTFRNAVGITGRGWDFHSFRHTYRDALRFCRMDLEISEALGGWSNSMRTSSRYGEGQTVDMLHEDIQRVKFEGLDLSYLYISH